MLKIILTGTGLTALTIAIHAIGISLMMKFMIRKYTGHNGLWRPHERNTVFVMTATTLLSLHLLESLFWAGNYLLLHDIEHITNVESAVYFSLVTFTTLGYGDITLSPGLRLLSGIEAMNGIFLFGWSTAMFFAIVQRTWARPSSQSSTDEQSS